LLLNASITQSRQGHIGRIVAGTLLGGLLGAVALVAIPFAGAPEHIISGVVLLAFAAAWALLAMLSERWTDQPQRWAFAPAIFMGVGGLIILVLAPTGNEGGWIWPPALLGSSSDVRSRRRDLQSRTPGSSILCSSCCCCVQSAAYETYREHLDRASIYARPADRRRWAQAAHQLHRTGAHRGARAGAR
jgi:hypothetical protein